jgi:hypothetical protein
MHTQNKPKRTKGKYAKSEKTLMWSSCERMKKQQLRLEKRKEKHDLRMRLRSTIRAFKNGPIQTVYDIARVSALLQASTYKPEEKALIRALEKREYVILEKKLVSQMEKSRRPKL